MINYTRLITDEEQKILENDLMDVKDWIDNAIQGKINNCLKRLANEERRRLISEGADMVPAKEIDLANTAFLRPEYKNRLAKETLIKPKIELNLDQEPR